MPADTPVDLGENTVLNAIEHYIVGLGEGLHRAQEQLSQLATRADGSGGDVVYQIPRLDFDFKVAAELQPEDGGRPSLHLRPASGLGRGGDPALISSVRGSLVAVPLQAGRARPELRLAFDRGDDGGLMLTATVRAAEGGPVEGAAVSFDVEAEDGALPRGLRFAYASVETDADGLASSPLQVPPGLARRLHLMMRVEVYGQVSRLHYVLNARGGAA